MGVVAALVGMLEARGDDTSSPRPRAAESSPSATTSTKFDRVPAGALMPNLIVLPADELGITGRGDRRALRFASVLANTGIGPLHINPVTDEICPPRQRYVQQRIFVDADDDSAFDHRRRLLITAWWPRPTGT